MARNATLIVLVRIRVCELSFPIGRPVRAVRTVNARRHDAATVRPGWLSFKYLKSTCKRGRDTMLVNRHVRCTQRDRGMQGMR